MLILSVESSCDETAVAVTENGRRVLSDAIDSQVALHAVYGEVNADKDPLDIIRADGSADPSRAIVITEKLAVLDCEALGEGDRYVSLNTDPTYVKEGSASYYHDGAQIWIQVNFAEPIDISDYVEKGYLHLWVYVGETALN